MSIRNTVIASILAAAVLPAVSNAADQDVMAGACGRAFAAKLGLATGDTPAYKLTTLAGAQETAMERFYSQDYFVDMVAHAPRTGATVAKARCTVSRSGVVISLETQPFNADPRTASAR